MQDAGIFGCRPLIQIQKITMNSNAQHFARKLVGSASALEKGLGINQVSPAAVSHMHTSSAGVILLSH